MHSRATKFVQSNAAFSVHWRQGNDSALFINSMKPIWTCCVFQCNFKIRSQNIEHSSMQLSSGQNNVSFVSCQRENLSINRCDSLFFFCVTVLLFSCPHSHLKCMHQSWINFVAFKQLLVLLFTLRYQPSKSSSKATSTGLEGLMSWTILQRKKYLSER